MYMYWAYGVADEKADDAAREHSMEVLDRYLQVLLRCSRPYLSSWMIGHGHGHDMLKPQFLRRSFPHIQTQIATNL
jgi:hypothetical protein